MASLMAHDLSELEVAVVMIDGVVLAGQTCVAALVITVDGRKVPVGLYLGDTENATVVTALLADLVARGLSAAGGLLVVIDGAKALATGVRKVFGPAALIQRCTHNLLKLWRSRHRQGPTPPPPRIRHPQHLGRGSSQRPS